MGAFFVSVYQCTFVNIFVMPANHKINRYKNLIADFRNWPSFLVFKSGKSEVFNFKMRNGFEIKVNRKMLPPFKESFFDRIYLSQFKNLFKGNDVPTIIDIGGNVGFFSLYMLSQHPQARVISFEPMPFNFGQLKKYNEHYRHLNWEVVNKAVSDKNDPLVLYSRTIEGFSTMASLNPHEGEQEKIEVPSMTYSEMVSEFNLERVDLMKMDCEGSEYPILYSMTDEELKNIRNMCIESHATSIPENSHANLLKFLKEKGFNFKEQMNLDGTGYIWAWH